MAGECTTENPCIPVVRLEERQAGVEEKVQKLEEGFTDMIKYLRDRVPPWVAIGFGVCGGVIGAMATTIVTLMVA